MAEETMPQMGQTVQILPAETYSQSGVYFLHLKGEVVYVGQAANMRKRIGQHLVEGQKDFDSVSCIPCRKSLLLKIERHFIEQFLPPYNQCHLSQELRGLIDCGWRPDPATVGVNAILNEDEACALLGMSKADLRAIKPSALPFHHRRKPRSASRYRAYHLVDIKHYRSAAT